MGPHRVVVPPPTLDEHLGLQERVELLSGQELVAEPAVEALAIAVLPRAAWFDEQGFHANLGEPLTHLLGRKLRAAGTDAQRWSAADILRYAAADKQVAQSLQYVLALKLPRHVDRQALTCVLVDQGQHTESTAVARSIGDEVIAPDVILVGWAEPYA